MKKEQLSAVPGGFRIITVGTGKPSLDLSRGGASTLVQFRDRYFLVDCGFNSMATLIRTGVEPKEIPNMLFTHQHNDHNGDYLHFLIGGWGYPSGRRRLNLVGPGVTKLHQFAMDLNREDIEYRIETVHFPREGIYDNVSIYEMTEEKHALKLDGVSITAVPLLHTIQNYGYRFEAEGKSVVVTGDTMYCGILPQFVMGCDVLVIDAMLLEYQSNLPLESLRIMRENLGHSHITQKDIIHLLTEAQPKEVILTHLGGEIELEKFRQLSRDAGYQGVIWEAHDGEIFDVV